MNKKGRENRGKERGNERERALHSDLGRTKDKEIKAVRIKIPIINGHRYRTRDTRPNFTRSSDLARAFCPSQEEEGQSAKGVPRPSLDSPSSARLRTSFRDSAKAGDPG